MAFYLQNAAGNGLFLTCDKEERKIYVKEQDFSENQLWYLHPKDGKLFCGNGTRLAAQWGSINVESNYSDDDYDHSKFYFHEDKLGTLCIGQLEDKDKKFDDPHKQPYLAVIDGRGYMGSIESAIEHAEKASIDDFVWEKIFPQQSTYSWVNIPKKDIPNGAFSVGEEMGQKVFPGRAFSSDGLIHTGKIWSPDGARWLACHDENEMKVEAFYIQSESGLYLTSSDFSSLTLEKLNFLPTQIWYWSDSYDWENKCPGKDLNKLTCASGNCLYMQGEDDPESIVYSSESTSEDNRHKFYSFDTEKGHTFIGKFTEKDADKKSSAFMGFHSQGYFKMGNPSKDTDMQFKWKKIPANQAYKWDTMDEDADVPPNKYAFSEVPYERLFIGRVEVNGVIHPGYVSGGVRYVGYIEKRRSGCGYQDPECKSITKVANEKFTVLCGEPDTCFKWVEMPDITSSRAYHCDYTKFPKNAVIGGIYDGAVNYVGRGVIDSDIVYGTFKPRHRDIKLDALHDGKMIQLEKFEVLTMWKEDQEKIKTSFDKSPQAKKYYFGIDNAEREVTDGGIDILCVNPDAEVDWVEYKEKKLPNNAVIAGLSDDGVSPTGIFYVGRGVINNDTIPGIFLQNKASQREKSEVVENRLYVLYCGQVHQLEKFQVLVVKKHATENSGEKPTTASEGPTEGDWKLIGTGDLPAGYEIIKIDQQNFSEHAEKIRSLTLKAIEDGTIKFAKKKRGNTNTEEKPKEEASLGDLVGVLGGLMTAFAPKEEAEQLQEQVDMMAGLLSGFKVEPSAPEKSQEEEGKPKKKESSPAVENAPKTVKFESQGEAVFSRENRLGTYTKTGQIIQGCPVYLQELSPAAHKSNNYYLFVGPNGCWRVGPDVTSYSGSVLKNPKKHKKTPPKSGWLYWNINSDDWSKDTSLELMEVSDDEEKKLEEKRKEDKKEAKKAVERVFTMAVTGTAETGKLTRDQLKVVLAGLIDSGYDIAFISDKKMLENNDSLEMFIEVADRDGDKHINLNELLFIMDLGDEKLDYKEMFTKLVKAADKDGNGLITTEELRFMIVTAGFASEEIADQMAAMNMGLGDIRGDKKLKIEEVVNLYIQEPEEQDPVEAMKQVFRMFDTNEDGFISKKELAEYMKTMGYVDEDDTPDYVDMMVNTLISGADDDMDGKLSYEEFCYMLQSQ